MSPWGRVAGFGKPAEASGANGAMKAASGASATNSPASAAAAIKQSVCRWCFDKMSVDDLAANAKRIGMVALDLLQPADFGAATKHGLICSMVSAPPPAGIPRGWNRVDNHAWLMPLYEERIDVVAKAKFPNLICFSGNRAGLGDDEGLENCAEGL